METIHDRQARASQFRDRLKRAMDDAGMSRAALARAAGIDRSTVSQMLMNEDLRMPGGHVLAEVSRVLGVSADWLLGLSDKSARVGDLIDRSTSLSDTGRAMAADDQIFAWHEEAAGYKIRHVPTTLPDMLKTDAMLRWEYAPETMKTPDRAIAAAHARMDWMRGTTSDYEIALPLHEIESFVEGSGYYAGLSKQIRAEQLAWLIEVYDQFFPRLRLFFFDLKTEFSAPLTVFGPQMAVIYVGRHYLAVHDRDRVAALSRHFDGLVREAQVADRAVPAYLEGLRERL